MTDPYDGWVDTYRAAGWTGTLPLPARRKTSPPDGFTGAQGAWPDAEDIDQWRQGGPQNLAIRLPPNVIGLDVDTYDGKTGLATFLDLAGRLGHPGATWETTSRHNTPAGFSAIRWYRLPASVLSHDMRDPGGDIELIRYGHRYVVVPPSVHPDGREYVWRGPDGKATTHIPIVGDLTELPTTWCDHLAGRNRTGNSTVVTLGGQGHAGTLHNPITERRDSTLAAYTMSCIARGFTKDETFALLDHRIAAVVPLPGRSDPFTRDDKERWWGGAVEKVDYNPSDPTAQAPGRHLVVRNASEIEMRVSDWLWRHDHGPHVLGGARYEHWIPLGGLTLLGGREGTGKSSWTARLCAQVTNGKMEGIHQGHPKGVLLAATEDDWAATIVPRLAAAGADLKRVYRVDVMLSDDVLTGLTLPTDVAAVRALIGERDIALVVLDPLMSTVDGKLDTHKDADVRRALEPISRLAADTATSILGLIHQNKSTDGDFLTKLMGSRAFSAVARAVLGCAETERPEGDTGPRQFVFGQEKNNLARRVETGIRYELEDAMAGLASDGRQVWTSKVHVVNYSDDVTVSEATLAADEPKRGASKQRRVMEFLRAFLAAQPDRRAHRRDAVAAVLASGSDCSVRTIDYAAEALGVISEGKTTAALWVLP